MPIALASATRGAGILVLLGLLIAALPILRRNWRSTRLWPRIAGLLLVPLGMGAFMLLLAKDTGNAWAFRDVQAAWSRTTDLSLAIPALQASLSHPSEISRSWDFKLLNVAATGVALVATAVLAAWRPMRRAAACKNRSIEKHSASAKSLIARKQTTKAVELCRIWSIKAGRSG